MIMPRQPDETPAAHPDRQPLVAAWINALARLATRAPLTWGRTRRRRRLLFLALCAPGFVAVFSTPLHHNFFLLLVGLVLFAAAALLRAMTEPFFERGAADGQQNPPSPPRPEDTHHA